jgi:hypothetical protein
MHNVSITFSAIPQRRWPVRGLFVLATEQGPLPGLIFNSEAVAQWVAEHLNRLQLSAQELAESFSSQERAMALLQRISADHTRALISQDVARLLGLLESINWSQAQLARKLQLDPNTVSRWITARTPVPNWVLEYLSALQAVKALAVQLEL